MTVSSNEDEPAQAGADLDALGAQLVGDALSDVLRRPELQRDLQQAELTTDDLEPDLSRVMDNARHELAPRFARIRQLEAELTKARKGSSFTKKRTNVANVLVGLFIFLALAMIVLAAVGLVGLLVTAINGHARWIVAWFRLPQAGIGLAVLLVVFIVMAVVLPSKADAASENAQKRVTDAQASLVGVKQQVKSSLVDEWLLPFITKAINDRTSPSYGTQLSMSSFSGLGEPLVPRSEVSTQARVMLEQRLRLWSGGSLGLAGPRGVGKTTLINALSRPNQANDTRVLIPVLASAPVKYESRDFILHLSNSLCEAVLKIFGVPVPKGMELVEEPTPARGRRILSGGISRLKGPQDEQTLRSLSSTVRRTRRESEAKEQFSLASTAVEYIKEIRFQQTYTRGWGGSITAPVGGLSLEAGRSLTRNPLSLPDIIARFKEFVSALAAAGYIVVIAIDELDKIASADEAGQFLNDIKGIFGAKNCFFLLSVSEEAMSAFERRGLPARDPIDSALDDVVTLDYMSFSQSADLLRRRVVGLPHPFIGLCHVLGGGLPRDTLRVARRLAEMADRSPGCELQTVAQRLTEEDLLLKLRAAEIASRGLDSVGGYFTRGIFQVLKVSSVNEIFGACEQVVAELAITDQDPKAHEAIQLIADGLSYAYFLSALGEFFCADHSEADLQAALSNEDSERSVDVLARARQAFASDPRLAWELTSTFRRAWGYPILTYPLASVTPARPSERSAIGASV